MGVLLKGETGVYIEVIALFKVKIKLGDNADDGSQLYTDGKILLHRR